MARSHPTELPHRATARTGDSKGQSHRRLTRGGGGTTALGRTHSIPWQCYAFEHTRQKCIHIHSKQQGRTFRAAFVKPRNNSDATSNRKSTLRYTHARAQLCPPLCDPVDYTAHQAPLSMEFSRLQYWSGLPFPTPGNFLNLGVKPATPGLAGGFFTTKLSGKPNGTFIYWVT